MTTSTPAPHELWYDPADYQSPYAASSKPLRQLLLALSMAAALDPQRQAQTDAMLAGMRVLLPQHSWWPALHGYILCLHQRFAEARDQVRGQSHPLAQLVLAWSAWDAGEATGVQQVQDALALLEPQAAALTAPLRLMLGLAPPTPLAPAANDAPFPHATVEVPPCPQTV